MRSDGRDCKLKIANFQLQIGRTPAALVDLGIAERISQMRDPGAYDRYKEL